MLTGRDAGIDPLPPERYRGSGWLFTDDAEQEGSVAA